MVRFVFGGVSAVLACVLAGQAWGQAQGQATASASSSTSDPTTLSDVVIESVRPGVVRRIDRTSYDIKDDPQAKAASLIDILGKLPSVSVGADGKVRLLGAGGVSVQFDGKTTQGTDIKLNSLTGADVERIEVITNPSSQFSAQGSGGIINIIMRKRQKRGLAGTAATVVGSDGVEVRLAPSLTLGKWTLGATLGATDRHYANDRWEHRTYLDAAGAALGTRAETDRTRQKTDGNQGEFKVTYRPKDKQSLMLSASLFGQDSDDNTARDLRSTYAGARSYAETQKNLWWFRDRVLDASYERQGPREGESLKIGAYTDRWRWSTTTDFVDTGSGSDQRFVTRRADLDDDTTLQLDYERPLGAKMMLTAGGSWIRNDHHNEQSLDNISGPSSLGASYARLLTSRRETTSGYATVQFPLLGWTVLPGLRYEDMTLDLSTTATGLSVHDGDLFPSLHVSKDVTNGVNLKFSYSRRIQRPEPDQLDPTIIYGGSDSAWSGNPNLKPVFTDAYEVKLVRASKRASLDVTLYDRESHGELAWTNRLTSDGVSLGQRVNAGTVTRRGGQASIRGPLVARVKYVLTANVFQRDGEQLDGGVLRRSQALSYDGSLQLDYKSPAPTSAEAQQLQLSLRMSGPSQDLQSRSSGYFRADFTWRRPITKKVSAVMNVTDLFNTWNRRNRSWGEGYAEVSANHSPPKVRLSLTYQLGGKP